MPSDFTNLIWNEFDLLDLKQFKVSGRLDLSKLFLSTKSSTAKHKASQSRNQAL